MDKTQQRVRRMGLVMGVLLVAWSAHAQSTWPSKPIRMIVGYPSGSSPDVQARLIAEPLSRALGQPVVVDNRPGASGNIGADLIAKAEDGHTIGVVGNGPLTSSKFLYPSLAYDPQRDLAPIALIGSAPLVWVVTKSPASATAQSYIRYARAEGDKLAYGSIGAGSGGHLGMELLKQVLNLKPLHVPYNGGPAIVNAMMGDQVQMALLPASTVKPLVEAGKIDAVAVTSAQRSPLAPTLPSMSEIGATDVDIEVWNAVMAPTRMPAANRERLSRELEKILAEREIKQKLFLQGWRVDESGAKALAQRIQRDTDTYRSLIARNQIRLE
jgi:tripartite-type tricarboxylate transporter receptor subunit TctC